MQSVVISYYNSFTLKRRETLMTLIYWLSPCQIQSWISDLLDGTAVSLAHTVHCYSQLVAAHTLWRFFCRCARRDSLNGIIIRATTCYKLAKWRNHVLKQHLSCNDQDFAFLHIFLVLARWPALVNFRFHWPEWAGGNQWHISSWPAFQLHISRWK